MRKLVSKYIKMFSEEKFLSKLGLNEIEFIFIPRHNLNTQQNSIEIVASLNNQFTLKTTL